MRMKNLKLTTDIEKAEFVTHNGKFHIDEVFSTALLIKIFDNVKLIRVSNVENIKNKRIIYDIGGGKYDHHQKNAKIRDDGIKYSSFGLLWKDFGKNFLKKIKCDDIEYVWNKFDTKFVETIDKIDNFQIEDNSKKNYLISNIIEGFNPTWNLDDNSDEKFKQAVELASIIFDNEITNLLADAEANMYLTKLDIDLNKNYLILDRYIPYEEYLLDYDKENKIKFVIYPSKRNGYEIRTVLDRAIFPEDWRGNSKEEFFNKYGIDGMMYCHNNGKLCIADNKENAIRIVSLI